MEQQIITNGGLQYIPQIAVQYVYLDFDGESTTYRNDDLDITLDVDVENSGMSEEQKQYILAELSAKYASKEIVFTTEKPEDGQEYSTIFIGQTDDFEEYGSFAGLAETIDEGNLIKDDNAFILADHTSDLDSVITVIDHEIGHIVKGMKHDITSGRLEDYAVNYEEEIYGDRSYPSLKVDCYGTSLIGLSSNNYYTFYFYVAGNVDVTVTITCKTDAAHNCVGNMLVSYENTSYSMTTGGSQQTLQLTFNANYGIRIGAYVSDVNAGASSYSLGFTFSMDVKYETGYDLTFQNGVFLNSKENVYDPYSSSQISVTNYSTEDNIYISFSAIETSGEYLGDITVNVYVDDVFSKSITVSPYHQVISWNYSVKDLVLSPLAAGIHTIKVSIAADDKFKERNIENNTHTTKIIVKDNDAPVDSNVTIYSSGILQYKAKSVSDMILGYNYSMIISNGGAANLTNVNGGMMYIFDGGVANKTTLARPEMLLGGELHISNGGVAMNSIVNSNGLMLISRGGEAHGGSVNKGGMIYISSGGTARYIHVYGNGGLWICSGGVANEITVTSDGDVGIDKGGMGKNLYLKEGAQLSINYGGKAGGHMDIEWGASFYAYQESIIDFTVSEQYVGGEALISNWSCITDYGANYTITVKADQASGTYILADGASGFNKTITVNTTESKLGTISVGRTLTVGDVSYTLKKNSSNLLLTIKRDSDPVIKEIRSYMGVTNGETVENVHVLSGGTLAVSSGGTTNRISVTNQGKMYLSNGGTGNETTVYSRGDLCILSGGSANNTTLNYAGYMNISNGGVANSNTVVRGHLYISSGGAANDTTMSGGIMYIYGSGVANRNTVSSGRIDLYNNGTANNTIIMPDGGMIILEGGIHRGSLQISPGAVVSVDNGAIIDFTVSNRTTSDSYLINDLSLISGTPIYTITVDAAQEAGTYKLAQGATALAGEISISANGTDLGKLTVNGAALTVNNTDYDLNNDAGNLTLTITKAQEWQTDLAISDFTLSVYEITTQDDVSLNFTVQNLGNKSASSFYTYIYDGNTLLERVYIDGLNASASIKKTYTINAGILGEGIHDLKIVADGAGAIPEPDDNNNSATIQLQVNSSEPSFTDLKGQNFIEEAMAKVRVLSGATVYLFEELSDSIVEQCGKLRVESGGRVANITAKTGAIINGITLQQDNIYQDTLNIHNGCVNKNGSSFLLSGHSASNILVESGASLEVKDGVTLSGLTVQKDGVINGFTQNTPKEYSGQLVISDTFVNTDYADIYSGQTVKNTQIISGKVSIHDGGKLSNTSIHSGASTVLSSGAVGSDIEVLRGGKLIIQSAASLTNAKIYEGGYINGFCLSNTSTFSGTLDDLVITNATVNDWTNVDGGSAHKTTIQNGGDVRVFDAQLSDTTILAGGEMTLYAGMHRGTLQIAENAIVSAYSDKAIIDFSVTGRIITDGYLVNDISLIEGTPRYTITVSADQAEGTYKLAQGASAFTGTLSIGDGTTNYGSITVNGDDLVYNDVTYSLDQLDGDLTLTIGSTAPVLTGNDNGVSWENISGNDFIAEYSSNSFANSLQIETESNAVDTFGLPAGTYQWRVKGDGEFVNGENIVSDNTAAPQNLISDGDDDMDVFFANADGKWSAGYAAEHHGVLNGWTGTKEQINLTGKNKISDVFSASDDANILVLTDGANGDALFVEDIYTALGDQARISQIDEIRAGAGDDIVDMTSQLYAYDGDGVKIYGGLGNDTIWANNGNNTLFGDAGDDRLVGGENDDYIIGGSGDDSLHGGGGDDIFCFGGDWGNDTVEQLAGGSVTLWFESGSEENWDEETLTYTDGANTVKVSGVDAVTLKFGDTDSGVAGAFLDAASEKIFEDKDKGMLA